MKNKQAAIGIFDSGIGGLTVAAAVARSFPKESILYFGDTAHLPYGEKSTEAILSYSSGIADFLIRSGCKMLVIACNTASAIAYEALKVQYEGKVPVVDVISPLVELVASKNYRKLGVIATKATVRSDIYPRQLQALQSGLEVSTLATSMLATMIEEGFANSDISQAVLHNYLTYPDFEGIEALLLACTHYPLIRAEIENFYGKKVAVYDSVDAVVQKIALLLDTWHLQNNSTTSSKQQFFVSDYTRSFEEATGIFYQKEVHLNLAHWENGQLKIPSIH